MRDGGFMKDFTKLRPEMVIDFDDTLIRRSSFSLFTEFKLDLPIIVDSGASLAQLNEERSVEEILDGLRERLRVDDELPKVDVSLRPMDLVDLLDSVGGLCGGCQLGLLPKQRSLLGGGDHLVDLADGPGALLHFRMDRAVHEPKRRDVVQKFGGDLAQVIPVANR